MLPPKLYAFLCACFAAMGAGLFGYDLGVIAYVIVAPDFLEVTNNPNASYMGFIVSSMLLGAFIGSIPASLIADAFSRRTAIVVAGVIFIIGGVLQTAAQNKEMMLAGRFFAGVGIGFLGVLAPLYQSEIAHPSNRGRLAATFQLFIGIGAFIAAWIGYGCQQGLSGQQGEWRIPLAFQMAPAIPLVCLTFLLPESPRWLMIKGRGEDALKSLARLHARGNINDHFVQGEYQEMQTKLSEEASQEGGWSLVGLQDIGLFKDRQNLRKVFYGIILQFSVQMTGVSAIQYYAATVYEAVGFKEDALLINSINSVMGILGQVACVLFLDKVGRRIPLVGGNIMSGCMFIGATVIAKNFAEGNGSRAQGIGFVICIYIYNIFFSACIGPLSWVYPAEIMNTAIRAKALALTSMSAWIANFMIGQVSPTAFENIGWKYYIVFTVCSFSNALLFYLLFPETKGRTLEEMDNLFQDSYWIVPLSPAAKVGTHDRERQLAMEGEGVPSKKELGHEDYGLGPNESRV